MTIKDLLDIDEQMTKLERFYKNLAIKHKSIDCVFKVMKNEILTINKMRNKLFYFIDELLKKGVKENDNIE